MSTRSKLDKAKSLRKLYERQPSKTPSKMDESKRRAMASSMMDELVGARWRVEISLSDVPVLDADTVAAVPAPTVGGPEQTATDDSFVRRVRKAAADEGEHADSVEFVVQTGEAPEDNIKRTLADMHQKICELMGLLK